MRKSRFFPLLSVFLLTFGGWSEPAQAGSDSAEVVTLYRAQAYAKVEVLARKLLGLRPGDATVRYYLANSLVMLHHYDQARQQYELCRQFAPGTEVGRLAGEAINRINSLSGPGPLRPGKPGASVGVEARAKVEEEEEAQKQSVIDKGAAIIESKRKVLDQDIARVRAEAEEALNLTFIRFNRPSEYNTDQRYNREVNRIKGEAEENIQHLRDIFEAEEKRISRTYAEQAERTNWRRNVTALASRGPSAAAPGQGPVAGRRVQDLRTAAKQLGLNDRELANLRNSEFVILIDESSMLDTVADTRVTKRAWCVENVGAFSRLAASENTRLTVVPCSDSFTVISNCSAADLAGQLSAVQNKGKLDIATPLEAQVSRHLGEKSQRPLVVAVLLGSVPSGGDDLERVVARLSQRVSEPGFVRLVFIALGADNEVDALVRRLDEGRLAGARFAMADGYKFAEIEKIGLTRALLNVRTDLSARLEGVNKNDSPVKSELRR